MVILEAIDDIVELPYPSDEDMDQGLVTADPATILKAVDRLAPGEYVFIQNISPTTSALAEYYCRKERVYAPNAITKASLRRNQGR